MTTESPRRSRKILAPLATLLVAGAIIVGSGASFTSSTTNAGNAYATGTLSQSNSKDNQAIFNASNLKPGDELKGAVTITNTGSLPAVFTLSEDATNGFTDPNVLTLTITQGVEQIYSGTFGQLAQVPLGQFAPDEARTFDFSVKLASTAGNDEQGKTASATYTWDSVQTAGEVIDQS